MTNTEIKKEFYKQKPIAHFHKIVSGIAYYFSVLSFEHTTKTVTFAIPISDMQETAFLNEMDAKLLLRWIV